MLMRRENNNTEFAHKDSTDYAVGFGNIRGNFWIGELKIVTVDGMEFWDCKLKYLLAVLEF